MTPGRNCSTKMSYSRMSRFTASTAEGFFKFKKMVFLLRPSQAAAAVVAERVQREYVNDERYAEARAHSLLAARKSRRAAARNLRQKGLSAQQVAAALEAVYAPDEEGENPELSAAVALVESRYRPKLAMGRRDLVVAALQRRGFAYAVVKEAIKRVEEE